ncbi:hypothetical protein HPP92_025382 [Vanilla planifolia]|uniref:Uncharacterized protein n=1 Tax=Vanilla planifolia TaxID=51239 RepID=A0A835PK03_VANPL|nr:hypothetical protein HPP92_025382 [Vanilla planifolia]
MVATTNSSIIGVFFCLLIVALHDKYAFIFTSNGVLINAVDHLSSGWQRSVAYVNIGSYYLIGIPVGFDSKLVHGGGVFSQMNDERFGLIGS